MNVSVDTLEYTAAGALEPAQLTYEGDQNRGWTVARNGSAWLELGPGYRLMQSVARRHADRLSKAAGVPYHLVPGREHTDVLVDPLTVELVDGFVGRLMATPGTSESVGSPAA